MKLKNKISLNDLDFDFDSEKEQWRFPTISTKLPSEKPEVLAVDTECTGLNWSKQDRPFIISAAWYNKKDELQTAFFQWAVDPFTRLPIYNNQEGLGHFISWYHDPSIIKVFANAKFDIHMIQKGFGVLPDYCYDKPQNIFDVLVAAWCCNTQEESYKLNNLAEKYIGIKQDDEKNLRDRVKNLRDKAKKLGYNAGPNISIIPEDYFLPAVFGDFVTTKIYALRDAERTIRLYYFLKEALEALDRTKTFKTEMEVMRVIFRMEERGIRFFEEDCIKKLEEIELKDAQLEMQIKMFFRNPSLNINSDKQLRPYIYNVKGKHLNSLNLQPIEFTEKANEPSLAAKTIEKLLPQDKSGILQLLLERAGNNTGKKSLRNYIAAKTNDSYVSYDDMPFIHCRKAVHCSFNQIASQFDKENAAVTGRLTSSNPNLQNVADPVKSSGLFVIDSRKYFGPREGYAWYSIDYSQLELRIFAERLGSNSPLYQDFITGRADPHDVTRRNVPYLAKMNPDIGRKLAKNTNFTIVNCGGAGVLLKKYGMPLSEGQQIVKELHEHVPEIKIRQKEAEMFAIENGYIETLVGRKVNVDLSRYSDTGQYKFAYRATSYDIQGSAADIIKLAMIATNKVLSARTIFKAPKYDARLILSIHDELIFEIHKKHSYKSLLKAIMNTMENVMVDYMRIPLKCELSKYLTTWSSYEKVKVEI